MEKILLIDGNSMLFRAYYATAYSQKMTTSSGIYTNAIYGFAVMLQKAVDVISPDKVMVALDHDKDNFRKEVYADYKGTRSATPDDLVMQFPILREYLSAINMEYYEVHGLEADDIIGSLAKKYDQTYDVNILTSDRDMLQLVDDNTKVWLMVKGISEMKCMTPEAIYEDYSLTPSQIIDLKGLSGDKSDNIPGVRKVGDKTAIKLLKDYGSVEGVYEHLDELKGKLKENLELDHEVALLSKQLATIKTDAEVDLAIDEAGEFDFDGDDALLFYSKYEMKSFLNGKTPKAKAQEKLPVEIVDKLPKSLLAKEVAMFIEKDNDEAIGIAIASKENIYYLSWEKALNDENFKALLLSPTKKVVYDVKGWYHLLAKNDLTIEGEIIDEMIVGVLLDCKI